ncbi:BRF1-domain-containing protein [Mycena floridula]|nr:BRF1-domain-containing protein [Mycena floridula]
MPSCTDCGGTVIEYDTAAGNGFCVKCGTVVEENTIVNEITFGETSSGGAMVQGSFVAQGATGARLGGRYGNRGNGDSREQTIANADKKIQSIAAVLHLSEQVCHTARRLYTLAVEHKFTKGRKSLNVVAVCLYVACRQRETRTYMLIDFSDLLQVNVFEIGHTYLQLVQVLNLRLPLVDPSHYISRFAALLEFGDETHKVATDAVRLVQRFDRDWMTRGRRPAGICGAALLLAARMNNFRRSVEEIVQVVKIADTTLKKRLDEFKNTPSGSLTLADFRSVWLDEEMDPPAFTQGKEKEEKERLAAEEIVEHEEWNEEKSKAAQEKASSKKRKRKKKRTESHEPQAEDISPLRAPIDPSLLNQGIFGDTSDVPDSHDSDNDSAMNSFDYNIDPALLQPVASSSTCINSPPVAPISTVDTADGSVSTVITDEVTQYLANTQAAILTDALDEAEQRRLARISETVVDDLMGLDEEELDAFLLSEEEVKLKERVWVEINRDYLEALAAKGDQEAPKKTRKPRKPPQKPRDASTAHANTAAESVRNLIKKNPKYSKRINYDALKDIFVDGEVPSAAFAAPVDLDSKADELYYMQDKDDSETVLVIQEEETGPRPIPDDEPDGMEVDSDKDDGELDTGPSWEDAYEQEL